MLNLLYMICIYPIYMLVENIFFLIDLITEGNIGITIIFVKPYGESFMSTAL